MTIQHPQPPAFFFATWGSSFSEMSGTRVTCVGWGRGGGDGITGCEGGFGLGLGLGAGMSWILGIVEYVLDRPIDAGLLGASGDRSGHSSGFSTSCLTTLSVEEEGTAAGGDKNPSSVSGLKSLS